MTRCVIVTNLVDGLEYTFVGLLDFRIRPFLTPVGHTVCGKCRGIKPARFKGLGIDAVGGGVAEVGEARLPDELHARALPLPLPLARTHARTRTHAHAAMKLQGTLARVQCVPFSYHHRL